MKTIKINGNRAVVINDQNGHIWANLYVNARDGMDTATLTQIRWTGKTMAGALRWASKQLSA